MIIILLNDTNLFYIITLQLQCFQNWFINLSIMIKNSSFKQSRVREQELYSILKPE